MAIGFNAIKSGLNEALKLTGFKRRQQLGKIIKENNITGIESTNYIQRNTNPNLKPTFSHISNPRQAGYWAIPEKDGSFSIIPNPAREYEIQKHTSAGGQQLFFNDFDKVKKDSFKPDEYKIVTPATANISGNNINFMKPGELDFGSGQKKEIGGIIVNLGTGTTRPNYAADIFPRQNASVHSQPVEQKPSTPLPNKTVSSASAPKKSIAEKITSSVPKNDSPHFSLREAPKVDLNRIAGNSTDDAAQSIIKQSQSEMLKEQEIQQEADSFLESHYGNKPPSEEVAAQTTKDWNLPRGRNDSPEDITRMNDNYGDAVAYFREGGEYDQVLKKQEEATREADRIRGERQKAQAQEASANKAGILLPGQTSTTPQELILPGQSTSSGNLIIPGKEEASGSKIILPGEDTPKGDIILPNKTPPGNPEDIQITEAPSRSLSSEEIQQRREAIDNAQTASVRVKTETPRTQNAQQTAQEQAEADTSSAAESSGGEEESSQGGLRGFFNRFRSHPNEYQQCNKAMIDALEKNSGATFSDDPSKLGRVDRVKEKRVRNEQKNFFNELRGAKNEDELADVMKNYNVGYEKGMDQGKLGENITDAFNKRNAAGPTIGDRMDAYHVHGIMATGVIGASVLGMADSRGQKSNSELYSDPFGQ